MPGTKEPTVKEILAAFKTPRTRPGRCSLMKKVDALPENVQAAVLIALDNTDITNIEIFKFFMGETDQVVNLDMIQKHRHKEGCYKCLYGGPK